jgi:hypothetical protein
MKFAETWNEGRGIGREMFSLTLIWESSQKDVGLFKRAK